MKCIEHGIQSDMHFNQHICILLHLYKRYFFLHFPQQSLKNFFIRRIAKKEKIIYSAVWNLVKLDNSNSIRYLFYIRPANLYKSMILPQVMLFVSYFLSHLTLFLFLSLPQEFPSYFESIEVFVIFFFLIHGVMICFIIYLT